MEPKLEQLHIRRKRRAARLPIISNAILLLIKASVALFSGSVGVLAEVINSLADLVGSVVVFFSVRASDEPPDETHAYGHGKIENLAGITTALFILLGGIYAIWRAVLHLIYGETVVSLNWALAAMGASVFINLGVSQYLLKVGKETDSPALTADGHHLQTDVLTSLGVFVGLGLMRITHHAWWDSVAALFVSVLVLRVGFQLAFEAVRTLSDAALPPSEEKLLIDILNAHPAVLGYHKLRTRKSGSHRHADVHVQIADTHTFVESHRLTEEIEDQMRGVLPNLHPIIHIEPYDDEEQLQRERQKQRN